VVNRVLYIIIYHTLLKVYCVEVVCDGKVTNIERRYSEFYELYKKVFLFHIFYEKEKHVLVL
jgi:hypothetical protein